MPYTFLPKEQGNLRVQIRCRALGNNAIVRSFDVQEEVSQLSVMNVKLHTNTLIDLSAAIGESVVISMEIGDDEYRYFCGVIEWLSCEEIPSLEEDSHGSIILLKVVPRLAMLQYKTQYRIFQELSAKDIILSTLKEGEVSDLDVSLQSAEQKRSYCVQYGESDFHFVSRLMEEEGVFYHFECTENGDTLCLRDRSDSAKACPVDLKLIKMASEGRYEFCGVFNISLARSVGYESVALRSFNPESAERVGGAAAASGKTTLGATEFCAPKFATKSEGDTIAEIILESYNALLVTLTGYSYCPYLAAGTRFTITGSAQNNGTFFIVSVKHNVVQVADDDNSVPPYYNYFVAIPEDVPFRPPLVHLQNRIHGTQTATVVSISDEEISCNEHGMVKVRFHWDSREDENEQSSCWMRVAQQWAGNGFGSIVIPRAGMEVLVTFVNGDPEWPIITRCLYNGLNLPPGNYPRDDPTVSTFFSRSSKGGEGFNELRIKDKKDEEEVYLFCQKDRVVVVQGDDTETVTSGSKRLTLEGKDDPVEYAIVVQKGAHLLSVKEGNYEITIDKGSQLVTVKEGDCTLTLNKGNLGFEVTGDFKVKVSGDIMMEASSISLKTQKGVTIESGMDTKVDSKGGFSVAAVQTVEFKGLEVAMDAKTGIKITGLSLKIEIQTTMELKANIQLSIEAMIIQIKGSAAVALQGMPLKLN
ncbi:MAG: type VI secretion system tip protein VgrG [Holosporales bacterium]|nr:type VI secretion system tip protein VgrG [Holosporales bacterium]